MGDPWTEPGWYNSVRFCFFILQSMSVSDKWGGQPFWKSDRLSCLIWMAWVLVQRTPGLSACFFILFRVLFTSWGVFWDALPGIVTYPLFMGMCHSNLAVWILDSRRAALKSRLLWLRLFWQLISGEARRIMIWSVPTPLARKIRLSCACLLNWSHFLHPCLCLLSSSSSSSSFSVPEAGFLCHHHA